MTIGERIRSRRKEMGITADEIADVIGVSRSTVFRYEKGDIEKLPTSVLDPIATLLSTKVDYLLGWTDDPTDYDSIPDLYGPATKEYGAEVAYAMKKATDEDAVNEYYGSLHPQNECYTFPILGDIAAGYGKQAIEEPSGDYETIPAEWLKGRKQSEFFVLRVKGNSMHPQFIDGDRVLVHKTTTVDSGTVVVMLMDEEATLKKVKYVDGEDWLELIPANPEYATKRIEGADLEYCRVLGEVKRLIRIVK